MARGNQRITVNVKLPTRLNDEERVCSRSWLAITPLAVSNITITRVAVRTPVRTALTMTERLPDQQLDLWDALSAQFHSCRLTLETMTLARSCRWIWIRVSLRNGGSRSAPRWSSGGGTAHLGGEVRLMVICSCE